MSSFFISIGCFQCSKAFPIWKSAHFVQEVLHQVLVTVVSCLPEGSSEYARFAGPQNTLKKRLVQWCSTLVIWIVNGATCGPKATVAGCNAEY